MSDLEGRRSRWLGAALELDRWLEERGDALHDPHDLLASPLVRGLTFGSRWAAVAWTQLGRRSPISPRRILRVPRARNSKGLALALAAQVRLAGIGGREERARELVELLYAAEVAWGDGVGWGYPFPWANRDFYAPAGTPSSVVTAFVGHALLDAAREFGWSDAGERAAAGGEFLRRELNRIDGDGSGSRRMVSGGAGARGGSGGTFCFSYTPLDHRGVHNANLLTASLLARLGREHGDESLIEDALRAARFTVEAQRADGSWPYGVTGRNAWVDSFHTGYSLVALSEIGEAAGVVEFDEAIERGLAYWQGAFLVGPAVSFYPGEPYPVDLHAVAHAIVLLTHFEDRIPGALEIAGRLADWSLDEMRGPDGAFYYRRYRSWRNRMIYGRWVQGWILLGLSSLSGGARR